MTEWSDDPEPVSESRFSENSACLKPEMRGILGFVFQKWSEIKPAKESLLQPVSVSKVTSAQSHFLG